MGIFNSSQSLEPIEQTQQLKEIKKKFLYEDADILELYEIFDEADSNHKGHLSFSDLMDMFLIEPNSITIPCLTKLYDAMQSLSKKVYFEQWVDVMSTFCLCNKQSVIKFVYDMMDTEQEKAIYKKDIIKYVQEVSHLTGNNIFPGNFMDAVEEIKFQKSCRITLEQFIKISEQLRFLCWPAIRLQELMRQKLLNPRFWQRLHQKLVKHQSEMKNNTKKNDAEETKKAPEAGNKELVKLGRLQKILTNKKIDQNLFKPKIFERKRGRRASDTINPPKHLKQQEQARPRQTLRQGSSDIYIKFED